MELVANNRERVAAQTNDRVNRRIHHQTELRLRRLAAQGRPALERRLQELEEEWDIERMLEMNASTLMLAGLALGATADRRWLILPAAVAGFLWQHAVQGWCPPLPILRRLGFRTQVEIEQERYALKVLRGDFGDDVVDRTMPDVQRLLAAVRG